MNRKLTLTELESLLNSIQFMIDNIMREAKINNDNDFIANQKLQKLTKYRNRIIFLIERELDEIFKED
jgi:hypothetical protein